VDNQTIVSLLSSHLYHSNVSFIVAIAATTYGGGSRRTNEQGDLEGSQRPTTYGGPDKKGEEYDALINLGVGFSAPNHNSDGRHNENKCCWGWWW
jgi:hypothetical protein